MHEIFGSDSINNINQLVSPFQCIRTAQETALHVFQWECIGTHIWAKRLRTESGRLLLDEVPCPKCNAVLNEDISAAVVGRNGPSRFPFTGTCDSTELPFFPLSYRQQSSSSLFSSSCIFPHPSGMLSPNFLTVDSNPVS